MTSIHYIRYLNIRLILTYVSISVSTAFPVHLDCDVSIPSDVIELENGRFQIGDPRVSVPELVFGNQAEPPARCGVIIVGGGQLVGAGTHEVEFGPVERCVVGVAPSVAVRVF